MGKTRFLSVYAALIKKATERHASAFEVMQALKLNKPQDDPVYQFILKKKQEGRRTCFQREERPTHTHLSAGEYEEP